MKNNLMQELGIDTSPFFQEITEYLGNNLETNLCQSLANLLTLDYVNRLKSEPPLLNYINNCIKRIKTHLKGRIILDNNFHEAMSLFVVAITQEEDLLDDSDKSKQQSQNNLIESTISKLFDDLTPEERSHIKAIITGLINDKDGKEIMNLIASDSKLLRTMISNAMNDKIATQEIPNIIRKQLDIMISQSSKIDRKVENMQNMLGKAALATSMLAASSLGLLVGGLTLPLLIVPTTVAAIKLAPSIEKKLNNYSIKKNPTTEADYSDLSKYKASKIDQDNHLTKSNSIEQQIAPIISQKEIEAISKKVNLESKQTTTPHIVHNRKKTKEASRHK